MSSNLQNTRQHWGALSDRLGIGVSGLCLIHCTVVPVALVALPLFPLLEGVHELVHVLFLAILIPITTVAMYLGYRSHGRIDSVLLMIIGLLLIGAAALLIPKHGPWYQEAGLTVVGSTLLISGHWRNMKLRRSCPPSADQAR
jgi:hypothetical protein